MDDEGKRFAARGMGFGMGEEEHSAVPPAERSWHAKAKYSRFAAALLSRDEGGLF